MKRWVVGLGLILALAVAAQPTAAQISRKDKKEKEEKEEKRRKRELEEANREYPGRLNGVIKSCTEYQLIVTVKSKKGEEQDINLTLNEKTKVTGLKKDETLADLPEGSKVQVNYTHKKDDLLSGTAVGVKLVKRGAAEEEAGEAKEETREKADKTGGD
jgi:hypothetical protein